MPTVKVYKIFNHVDETDKEFYVGSTKQKYLANRWGNHTSCCKKGLNRKLYNHMREKGIENFKCIQLHSEEIDDKDIDTQRALEQKYVDELKPTLNMNNAKGYIDGAVDKARVQKTINELREYNSDFEKKWALYGKEYHKTYTPIYYLNNKDKIKANCKKYHEVNKKALTEKKTAYFDKVLESKKFYCESCNLPCRSIGALNKHNLSKRHLKKVGN